MLYHILGVFIFQILYIINCFLFPAECVERLQVNDFLNGRVYSVNVFILSNGNVSTNNVQCVLAGTMSTKAQTAAMCKRRAAGHGHGGTICSINGA